MKCCSAVAALSEADQGQLAAALRLVGQPGAETLTAIARRLGVPKSSLSKHRTACLGLEAAAAPWRGPQGAAEEPAATETVNEIVNAMPTQRFAVQPVARASPPDPAVTLAEERVATIADLLRFGLWKGDGTVTGLVAKWGLGREDVHRLLRVAASRVRAGRGGKVAQQELSVARCTRIHDDEVAYADKCDTAAVEAVKEGEFKAARAYRSLASSARATALAAQKAIDSWHNLRQPIAVQVNLQTQPDFAEAWELVRRMLDMRAPGLAEWIESGLGAYEDGGKEGFAGWMEEAEQDRAAIVVAADVYTAPMGQLT